MIHPRRLAASLATVASLGVLGGCPSDGNPDVLWLALDGTETQVRLVEDRPGPF